MTIMVLFVLVMDDECAYHNNHHHPSTFIIQTSLHWSHCHILIIMILHYFFLWHSPFFLSTSGSSGHGVGQGGAGGGPQ